MNNKEFIAALAAKTGFKQDETQKMVRSAIAVMGSNFENGDSVSVPGFGTFEIKKRLERVMTNPATGQRILVPPKLVLNFRPNASVKEQLKKGDNQ